jgi:hypothetical protein
VALKAIGIRLGCCKTGASLTLCFSEHGKKTGAQDGPGADQQSPPFPRSNSIQSHSVLRPTLGAGSSPFWGEPGIPASRNATQSNSGWPSSDNDDEGAYAHD